MLTQKVYSFSIEQKQSCWDKSIYKITADSYEKALEIAKDIFNNKVDADADEVYAIGVIEDMISDDNSGFPTRLMTYEDNLEIIASNGVNDESDD